MERKVLAIPIEELESHFKKNTRQDIKIIAPSILTEESRNFLVQKGKDVKPEIPVPSEDNEWKHSDYSEPNRICESSEFIDLTLPQYTNGPFAISFANREAHQDEHYHSHHIEIYYSEHPMSAEFRYLKDKEHYKIELKHGGVIIFAPDVIHKLKLSGLTIVIEIPSIENDRTLEEVRKK